MDEGDKNNNKGELTTSDTIVELGTINTDSIDSDSVSLGGISSNTISYYNNDDDEYIAGLCFSRLSRLSPTTRCIPYLARSSSPKPKEC